MPFWQIQLADTALRVLQTADILVHIVRPVVGRKPSQFETQTPPRSIVASLIEEHGHGVLTDSDGATVLANQDVWLEAGTYTFTVFTALSGNEHSEVSSACPFCLLSWKVTKACCS